MLKMKRQTRNLLFWTVIFLLCLFLACLCTNYDYDFFARLIVGEKIIENHVFLYNDFLSYTPTHAWYDHEWGSSVVFYSILKFLGPFGLLLFYSVLFFGTTYFIVKTQSLQRHAYPKFLIFTAFFLLLYARLHPVLLRCHLFTFFFFSVFLYILEKQKQKGTRLI